MKVSRRRTSISWADLLPDILVEIGDRLKTRDDILRFYSVCKAWRSLTPRFLFPPKPHNLSTTCSLYAGSKFIQNSANSRKLVASSLYLIKRKSVDDPSNNLPWIVSVEEYNPGKFYLRKPLTRFAIKDLPESYSVPKVLDLSRLEVRELARTYNIRPCGENVDDMFGWVKWSYFNNKVVLMNNGEGKSTLSDCKAIVLNNEGSLSEITLKSMNERVLMAEKRLSKFDDIINFDSAVYAVDRKGRAYKMTGSQSSLSIIVRDGVGKGCGGDHKKRLLESCGQLYLLHYYSRDSGRLYKLNEAKGKWDIDGVGDVGLDRILIVTFDTCVFIESKDLPGWTGNSIVYHRGAFPSYRSPNYWKLRGVELEIVVFLFTPTCNYNVRLSHSRNPGHTCVFWPPPAWLSSHTTCSYQVR